MKQQYYLLIKVFFLKIIKINKQNCLKYIKEQLQILLYKNYQKLIIITQSIIINYIN